MNYFYTVVPDLESVARQRKGGQVPASAVELASQYCMRYIRSRCHEDLDKVLFILLTESYCSVVIIYINQSIIYLFRITDIAQYDNKNMNSEQDTQAHDKLLCISLIDMICNIFHCWMSSLLEITE